MPFKNPAKRRRYHREYKRDWRKRQAHPLKAFKVYICPRFPGLRVGQGYFEGGFLITDNPDIQAQVEGSREFGKFIFRLALDVSTCRKEDEPEEE